VVIVTISSVISLLLGSTLAYAISRFRTGGRNYPYSILTIRMLPPIVVAIPMLIYYASIPHLTTWLVGRRLEFFDTYYGLTLLYIATTLPYVIWMMLAFIDEVPRELEHAARLMGAGRLTTIRRVVFPLVASGMMVTLLFVFILNWSEFLLALTLSQPKVLTLPVLLNKFQSAVEGRLYGPQAAIGTVVTIPVVIFGFLIQKHLVKGFSFGMIRR
jgi:multiple sugar transport system permease protein